ncbi:flavodoxin family protein [Virgibacillus proomii]|uniref:flavodoxin family protein n=1 Tax=Virgibacillus proomii TaxID=84407 RepID=UPI001C112DE0|nr:NAD(P)H-dependent oxidoreductase [Virgibacillus proomii]MBU5266633.1 flavodoxin family protein [Virgibacillus proomii]
MNTVVFHGSTRINGNTEYLAHQAVPKELATHIYLRDYHIQPIVDERHSERGFPNIEDDHNHLIEQLLNHDIIVFATPIYWYGMSGPMKRFIDRWSQTLRDPKYPDFRQALKGKQVYLVLVGGDNPHIKGLPLVQQFRYICQFFDMELIDYVIGQARKPGDIIANEKAIRSAKHLISDNL